MLASYYGLESITYGKIFGIILCFVGVLMVALQDFESDSNPGTGGIGGDIVALLAAFGYAVSTTILRKCVSPWVSCRLYF